MYARVIFYIDNMLIARENAFLLFPSHSPTASTWSTTTEWKKRWLHSLTHCCAWQQSVVSTISVASAKFKVVFMRNNATTCSLIITQLYGLHVNQLVKQVDGRMLTTATTFGCTLDKWCLGWLRSTRELLFCWSGTEFTVSKNDFDGNFKLRRWRWRRSGSL